VDTVLSIEIYFFFLAKNENIFGRAKHGKIYATNYFVMAKINFPCKNIASFGHLFHRQTKFELTFLLARL
jgi:hypothetical protein